MLLGKYLHSPFHVNNSLIIPRERIHPLYPIGVVDVMVEVLLLPWVVTVVVVVHHHQHHQHNLEENAFHMIREDYSRQVVGYGHHNYFLLIEKWQQVDVVDQSPRFKTRALDMDERVCR